MSEGEGQMTNLKNDVMPSQYNVSMYNSAGMFTNPDRSCQLMLMPGVEEEYKLRRGKTTINARKY
jgi:hypothetical protein